MGNQRTMKAAIFTRYGAPEGIAIGEVSVPEPKPNEVRVRVRAATVTAGDTEIRRMAIPAWLRLPFRAYAGLFRPKRIPILGMELAGEVDAVGTDVTRFAAGDAVVAATGFGFGAYAEYACLREDGVIVRKPEGLSFGQAAALPVGAMEALALVTRAGVATGERVMVYGGSGSIGSYAIQLAKRAGAEVSTVCGPGTFDLMHSLGASGVIDYTTGDFERDESTWDVIIDAVGKSPFGACVRKLAPGGRYVLANPRLGQLIRGVVIGWRGRGRVLAGSAEERAGDLEHLCRLASRGELRVIVDRTYVLDEIVDAHRYVDTGTKIGNVVIAVGPPRP